MLRANFENELESLQDELLLMGSMVSQSLKECVNALKQQDLVAAKRLILEDRQINAKRYAIEEQCLFLIISQQPMAGDTRLLASVLEISTELERIGDYAKGIGKIALLIGKQPLLKPLTDIPKMCELTRDMLRQALDAFVANDVEAAWAIPRQDDQVDALYNQVYRDLIEIITKDISTFDQVNHLMWAAHNLERAADRVTNICERTIFTVTGEFIEFDEMYD